MTRCSESPHSLPQQLRSLFSFHGDALLLPGSTAVVESFLSEVSRVTVTCLVTCIASRVATMVLWFVTCHRKLKCISGNWTEGLGKGPELCHVLDWWAIGPTLVRCPFGLMISRWSGQVTALRLRSIIVCYWNMCSEAWLQRLLRKQTLCVTCSQGTWVFDCPQSHESSVCHIYNGVHSSAHAHRFEDLDNLKSVKTCCPPDAHII